MFCQKCSLHYPDHLSFCRRCGQTLVHSNAETIIESHCCTRCGARVVRGENFCQHCGNRAGVAMQETVIGACYHCGASWRSGWIFCKNCGLDRKRALLLSTSAPLSGSLGADVVQQEEFTEIAKINCPACGAEAKPYSKFCEVCGSGLTAASNPKTTEPTSSATPLPNATNAQESSSLKLDSSPAPKTIFEPKSLSESDNRYTEKVTPSETANNLPSDRSGDLASAATPSAKAIADKAAAITSRQETIITSKVVADTAPRIAVGAVANENGNPQAKTVVTPLPPFGGEFRSKDTGSFVDAKQGKSRFNAQSIVLVSLAILLILFVYWWFNRDSLGGLGNLFNSGNSSTNLPNSNANKNPKEGMVYVPGGQFEMGLVKGDEYETPAHTETVKPFFMDRTEVTNEQYLAFVTATKNRAPSHWNDGKFPTDGAKLPVVNVSWDDVEAYAKWIGKRLPTEAEWEFAARGSDGRIYPWGNVWVAANANANHIANGAISKVGSFPAGASPFGALDMCGNVWEWTASDLLRYSDQKKIADGKVIRGGAFNTKGIWATATYRGVSPIEGMGDRSKIGFRLVLDAQ
ncbi:MAG: SUMF1/EgtB/PvdO family nonheme iron enzyme [Blastocatellia bacterium]